MKMRDYIFEQPETLGRVIANRKKNLTEFANYYEEVNPDHVYIIACGSSYNSVRTTLDFLIETLDTEVTIHYPSALPIIRSGRSLIIVVSQGGESTNTIAAIKKLSSYPLVAVTGETSCTINDMCDRKVYLDCGPETAGPKTKGYTATIMSFYMMALEAALKIGKITANHYEEKIALFEKAASNMKENIKRADAWMVKNVDELTHATKFVMTGKGVNGVLASECALKILETLLVPAMGFEFEEFLHGPVCTLDEAMAGVYLLADDEDKARMLAVANMHKEISKYVYIVTSDETIKADNVLNLVVTGDPATTPFEYILPAQFIGSEVPIKKGIEGKGMQFFAKVDKAVGIKVDNSSNE